MKKSVFLNCKHILGRSTKLTGSVALVKLHSPFWCLIVELPARWKSRMTFELSVAPFQVNVVFINVPIEDWMKAASLAFRMSSNNSIGSRTMLLHQTPKPNPEGNFISRWTLPNRCHYRPHRRVAVNPLSCLTHLLAIDNVTWTTHVRSPCLSEAT